MGYIELKPGRERSLLRRHPWVYSGAIAKVLGEPAQGATVRVTASTGEFLAWGAYSPNSQIMVRVWSWKPDEEVSQEFFENRLHKAIERRRFWINPADTNALRLVHAESDSLPGLIVDRYGDTLVVQYLSCGAEYWRETLADLLLEITGAEVVYERSDVAVRELEGLPPRKGCVRGSEPPGLIHVIEHGLNYGVDVRSGFKTGFYIDQRENRFIVKGLSQDKDVLDCFSYTGGFTVAALAGNARSVIAVDRSSESLAVLEKNLELNELSQQKVTLRVGDVFQVLRELRDRAKSFDLIILDPPKFAATSSQAYRAARGYKDINLLALKLLRPGGVLVTFSCSGGISAELFKKIVTGAALDARANAQIIKTLWQGPDHPVALNFPEGGYLKGLVIQVG